MFSVPQLYLFILFLLTLKPTESYRWYCDLSNQPIVDLVWNDTHHFYDVNRYSSNHGSNRRNIRERRQLAVVTSSWWNWITRTEEEEDWQDRIIENEEEESRALLSIAPAMSESTEFQRQRQIQDNDSSSSSSPMLSSNRRTVVQARWCHCASSTPTMNNNNNNNNNPQNSSPSSPISTTPGFYCPLPRTHCGIPNNFNPHDISASPPGCVDLRMKRKFARSVWPVVMVWYFSLVLCFCFTAPGRHALCCCLAFVIPTWNTVLANYILRRDPHDANRMILTYMTRRRYELERQRRRREQQEQRQQRRRRRQQRRQQRRQENNNNENNSNIIEAQQQNMNNNNDSNSILDDGNNNNNNNDVNNPVDRNLTNNNDNIESDNNNNNNNNDNGVIDDDEEDLNPFSVGFFQVVAPPTGPTELALKTKVYRSKKPSASQTPPPPPPPPPLPDVKDNDDSNDNDNDDPHPSETLDKSDIATDLGIAKNETSPTNSEDLDEDDDINDNNNNNNSSNNNTDEYNDLLYNNEDCSICYIPLEDGDRVGALPCTHIFHVDCLKGWLVRRNVCPLCLTENIATPRYNNNNNNNPTHPQEEEQQEIQEEADAAEESAPTFRTRGLFFRNLRHAAPVAF